MLFCEMSPHLLVYVFLFASMSPYLPVKVYLYICFSSSYNYVFGLINLLKCLFLENT